MKIATEELRKLADHANERLLRVMPIDADMIAALAAELITAREALEEWKASQHYSYIGADGKTVKARDLEDELVTARAKLEAADNLAKAVDNWLDEVGTELALAKALAAYQEVRQ